MSTATSLFRDWLGKVSSELDGKDPRRTKARVEGRVVFLLRDSNDELARGAILTGPNEVAVTHDAVPDSGQPTAFVRGRIEDCVRFFASSDPAALADLQIFGDLALFEKVAQIAALARDTISIRSSLSSTKNTTRTQDS